MSVQFNEDRMWRSSLPVGVPCSWAVLGSGRCSAVSWAVGCLGEPGVASGVTVSFIRRFRATGLRSRRRKV